MKAIIFDLDNTLYAYGPCHDRAIERALSFYSKKTGFKKSDVRRNFELSRNTIKRNSPNSAQSHHRLHYFIELLERDNIYNYKLALDIYNLYWQEYFKRMVLFKEVIPLLKKLKKLKIKRILLTDQLTETQIKKLIYLRLHLHVDFMLTSEQAGVEKPNSKCFSMILKKLNLEKRDVLVVGDSLDRDIEGAKKSGLSFIWFNHENHKSIKGKYMARSFNELAKKVLLYARKE